MDRRSFLLALGVTAAAGLVATETQAATWYFLGKRKVNGLVDFDQIDVGAGAGTFDKIKLKVTGNALLIYDLDVRYGNGAHDDLPVRLLIPQGGWTRDIDLRFSNRYIRHVRFTYGKFPNGRGDTWVELYGRR